jgi:chemotaxis signal transduction protein
VAKAPEPAPKAPTTEKPFDGPSPGKPSGAAEKLRPPPDNKPPPRTVAADKPQALDSVEASSAQSGSDSKERRASAEVGFGALLDAASARARTESRESAASPATALRSAQSTQSKTESVCTFWLSQRCFGIGVELVAEVVAVSRVTPVPMARSEIIGLFNLRGTPVPVLDLAVTLGFGSHPRSLEELTDQSGAVAFSALVLRTPLGLVGVYVDRAEMVVAEGSYEYVRSRGEGEHAAVSGFIQLPDKTVTVFDGSMLVERIQSLRFQ